MSPDTVHLSNALAVLGFPVLPVSPPEVARPRVYPESFAARTQILTRLHHCKLHHKRGGIALQFIMGKGSLGCSAGGGG